MFSYLLLCISPLEYFNFRNRGERPAGAPSDEEIERLIEERSLVAFVTSRTTRSGMGVCQRPEGGREILVGTSFSLGVFYLFTCIFVFSIIF